MKDPVRVGVLAELLFFLADRKSHSPGGLSYQVWQLEAERNEK